MILAIVGWQLILVASACSVLHVLLSGCYESSDGKVDSLLRTVEVIEAFIDPHDISFLRF
jgi:hypothetical protein